MSYQFSEFSRKNLETCHPDLQVLFNEVIKHIDCRIMCGHRGREAQNAAYPKYSKVQYPNSRHNTYPSMAVDVVPYPELYSDTEKMYYLGGFVLAMAIKLKEKGKILHDVRFGALGS